MKRFFTIVLFLAAGVATANAQQRKITVSGVVADAQTRQSLTGVMIGMSPVSDATKTEHIVTGAGGTFSTGLTPGEYNFEVSLVGYETLRKRIEVASARMSVDTLYLPQGMIIDEIVKSAVAMRTSLSGDTLIYNADAYKVAADSDVSGLLQKMPGVRVENGEVQAQGETVKKILIDGREFFGEDVTAAITSLPAEVVKSIEVFDKLSDNAEFTGIDDGEGYKAINIRTRESMRQGIMGQVSALYGAEPPDKNDDEWHHYGMLTGNVNIFQGDAKITVGGTLNNLNERNFRSADFLGAGSNDGIAKVARFQLNYIDTWGKKDAWKIDASYRYGGTNSKNNQTIDREYYETSTSNYSNYGSDSYTHGINQEHELNARIDYKPNSRQELRIRPYLSYQDSSRDGNTGETYYPLDPTDPTVFLNNWNNRNNYGWNTGLNANYRVRLGKPGRTLSFFFNGRYRTSDQKSESYSERQNGTNVQQYVPSYTYSYNLSGGATYTEPVSASSLINFDYSVSYDYSDNDRKSYLYNFTTDEYDPNYDPSYSGVYNSGYLIQRVGPGYRMQKNGTTLAAGVFYQYSTLTSTRVLPQEFNLDTDYSNVTYSLLVDSKFNKNSSLRMMLNSYTRNPSVGDLQDVVDISNVQNITKGDRFLRPSYGNRLMMRYILPNTGKGRTLTLQANGSYTLNSITSLTIHDSPGFPIVDSEGNVVENLDAVGRFTQPVNMDGEWSARFGVDYGFPLNFMKSNLNLNADVRYNEAPSQMGQWDSATGLPTITNNYARKLTTGGGATLGSNISERIDFRVGYNILYNKVSNTGSSTSNSTYLQHVLGASCKFVLPLDFTINGSLNFDAYNSLTGQNIDRNYVTVNAGIGKKIFHSKQWEVNLFCNDIFNQNNSFRRVWEAQYIQSQTGSVIGRYFGVKLTWNIRKFGKNGSQNPAMYENTGDGERRFDGPPQGMGGGRPPGGGGGGGYRGGGGGFGPM